MSKSIETTLIFKNGAICTQEFGARPEYYQQFNLKGHEGRDYVPNGSDNTILAVEGGEVVRDIDDPRYGGAYGTVTVILNKENKRAWWYAHEANNIVSLGQQIEKGQPIAIMGATGNVDGAHLHLGLRHADDNGNAINMNNGYQGFVDPLPVLETLDELEMTIKRSEFERLITKLDSQEKVIGELTTYKKERDAYVKKLETAINEKDHKLAGLITECQKQLRAQLAKYYDGLEDIKKFATNLQNVA